MVRCATAERVLQSARWMPLTPLILAVVVLLVGECVELFRERLIHVRIVHQETGENGTPTPTTREKRRGDLFFLQENWG